MKIIFDVPQKRQQGERTVQARQPAPFTVGSL